MVIEKLKTAGFNDDEIKKYVNNKSEKLLQGGFNEQEVNEYFGIKEPDKNIIKDYWNNIKETLVGEEFEPDVYWERGLGRPIFSLIKSHNTTGKLPEVYQTPEPEDTGYLEGFIERGTALLGDLPFYTLGAFAGSRIGGETGGAFGAGFVPGTIREMYLTALEKGDVNTWEEWWKIFTDEGIKAGLKEGTQLAVAAKAPSLIGPIGKNYFGKLAAQVTGFEATGALLHGELPTKDDLVYSTGFFAAFGAGERAVSKYINASKKTGKKPAEVFEDTINDPTIREDIVSRNIENPRAYKNIIEKKPKKVKAEQFIKPEKSKDPDIAQVQQKISFDSKPVKTYAGDIFNTFKFDWLDKLHPILRTVKEGEKIGVKVKEGTLNPYELARLQPGMISRGEYFLKNSTLDFKTLKDKSEPFESIVEPIIKDVNTYKEFGTYAVAKRAIEKESQGYKTGIDLNAAKNTVNKLDKKYKDTLKRLQNYQKSLLDYLKDSEIINKKTYDIIIETNKDYVPFFRVMEEGAKPGAISNSVGNPLKKFKGSEKFIIDPIESVYKNTLHFVTMVEKNRSLVELIKFIEEAKKIDSTAFPEIGKIKAKIKRTQVTREELENVVTDISKIDKSALEGFEIFRANQQQLGKTEVAIFRNGKREVWDLGSDLSRSWKYSTESSQKLLRSIFGLPARTLRAGATLAPEFFLRNLIRDTNSATVFSRNGFVLGLDTARGLMIRIKGKKSKIYQDWVKSGGPQSSYVAFDKNYYSKNIRKELTETPVYNVVKKPLEMLRVMTEFFENASRLGEFSKAYKNARAKGLNHKQALERGGFESRDITIDFQKMGSKMMTVNALSAFYNARVQGYLKLYETFKDPKRRYNALYTIGASITLPSILLWIANHDDERYKQLPRWQKDLFWIVITGEGEDEIIWRIPKPFELGYIFGTLPEKALDYTKTKDPAAIKRFIKDLAKENMFNIMPIPDIAKPIIEGFSNKSLFTKKPIVPRSLEGLLPEYQFTEYTSETSKVLGKLLRQISGEYSGASSPARIDSIINNWTGTLGRTFVSVLDKSLIKSGIIDDPVKPKAALSDIPIIRAFVVRNPTAGSEYITTFYEKYEPIRKTFNTIDKLKEQGNFDEAIKLMEKIPVDQVYFKNVSKQLRKHNTMIKQIYNSKQFEPSEKRQLIDGLYQNMIDISKLALQMINDRQ
tara:strand:- start:279 stop:3842 length:3564 start_codon:yes stop_codon:yes gene_type:complete